MRIRSPIVTCALGLGLIAVSATVPAYAATPAEEARALLEQAVGLEEQADEQRALSVLIYDAELDKAEGLDTQAALRFTNAQQQTRAGSLEAARASIEQGLGIAGQADESREIAALIYDAELKKAEAQHDQAEIRRSSAQDTYTQAGLTKQATAAGLRLEGHILLFGSQVTSDRSTFDDRLSAAASDRAKLLRQTARVVRNSNPDVALQAYASQMEQQADLDQAEAQRLNRESNQLSRESTNSATKADNRFRTAERLDPGGF